MTDWDDPRSSGDFYDEELDLAVNDTELYLERVGPRDAPALVYLHGGPGYNSYSFRQLIGEDLEQHFQMIYLDQRGAGRSAPLDGELNIDTLVDDLEAVREHLSLERITPLGHGFGAVLALEYGRRFPRETERVIAVNPWLHLPELALTLLREASSLSGKPFTDPKDDMAPQGGEFPAVGHTRAERAFSMVNARDLLNALEFPTQKGRLQLEFADAGSQLLGGGEVQESLVRQGFWEFEYVPYLLEQTRPVYAIAGLYDRTSYPTQLDWLLDLAGAEVDELEAGHYPWVDDPEGFVRALERAMGG